MSDIFDYVIIGAGSAGCVLANRLSADPAIRVCLIEAGPPNRSPYIHVPLGMVKLTHHKILGWQDQTVAQKDAAGRSIPMPHGRTLGGSSSINGMVYMRGHPRDYDEWAAAGNPGWSYRDVLPYFRRSEHNEQWAGSEFHGAGGPLNVRDPSALNPMVKVLFEATDSLQLPRNADFNGAQQEGFGLRQITQRKGRRESTATAFLNPVKRRPNLRIMTSVVANRILFDGRRATGVELAFESTQHIVMARREIIVAAGAISSPLLLLRSGIGDAEALRQRGIAVTHHLPGVGGNLQDHVAVGIKVSSPSSLPYGLTIGKLPRIALSAIEYLLLRRGLFASNVMQAGGFVRTEPSLDRPDIQYSFMPALRNASGGIAWGHGYTLSTFLLRPRSRGTVGLAAGDVRQPAIDPRFFSAADDIEVLLRGLKLARRILAAPAFDKYRGKELMPGAGVQSDDQLKDFIRKTSATAFHPVGTCRMGNDVEAVVDAQLRVRGVEGLRVVDASVMPTIIGGNTNAPVIMIAEKASDMILGKPPLAADRKGRADVREIA